MSWILELLDATSEAESPRSFFYWAGLSAISAVVKNNVYLDKFYYRLTPNLYVMLVAKSGMRKSFPISLAKQLVQEVGNTRIISGRSSIQAIIQDLSKAYTLEGKTEIISDSSAFLAFGEFSSALIDDPNALTILTDLYDTHYNGVWKNTLKGSGVETLKSPCLTMLAATNQAHFIDKVNEVAVLGGFVGRTLLVLEEKKALINPLTEPPKKEFNVQKLSAFLKEVAKVKGQFQYSPGGKKLFEDWYNVHAIKDIQDKTGTSERLHDHVLKVAMILSLSRGASLVIEHDDVEGAIEACTNFTISVKKVTLATGKGQFSASTALVLRELLSSPEFKVERTKLLQKHYGDFDAFDLDRIVESLTQSGAVKVTRVGSKIVYVLQDRFIKQYQSYKQEEKGDEELGKEQSDEN